MSLLNTIFGYNDKRANLEHFFNYSTYLAGRWRLLPQKARHTIVMLKIQRQPFF